MISPDIGIIVCPKEIKMWSNDKPEGFKCPTCDSVIKWRKTKPNSKKLIARCIRCENKFYYPVPSLNVKGGKSVKVLLKPFSILYDNTPFHTDGKIDFLPVLDVEDFIDYKRHIISDDDRYRRYKEKIETIKQKNPDVKVCSLF